jgi:hypothetical protein
MPISLEIIEQKLNNREFKNLTELEAYFKRMVTNAKEYYNKNSSTFEDAERVRKALSNYMTKTNPAYKLVPNFSCQPTPIPEDLSEREGQDEVAARTPSRVAKVANGVKDSDQRPRRTARRSEVKDDDDEEDGLDEDEDEDEEAEGDGDDEEDNSDARPSSGLSKRSSTGPRRDSGRVQRAQADRGTYFTSRYQNASGKADSAYVNVAYKGLTFQEAQEKIVEELIRRKEDE